MAALVADGAATFLAMEQPEDLGALASGPHEGLRPASMWQWPQLADLLSKGLRTVAFHQASFGTPYAKPTRLLLHTSLPMPDCVYEGMPRYDSKGCYTGPLPSAKGHGAMFQRQAKGAFNSGPLSSVNGFLLCWSPRAYMLLTLPLGRGTMICPRRRYRPAAKLFR